MPPPPRRSSTRRRSARASRNRRALIALAAVLLSAPSSLGGGTRAAIDPVASEATRIEREVVLTLWASRPPEAGELAVLFDNRSQRPRAVRSLSRASPGRPGEWRLLLWIDPSLAPAATIARAATELALRAEDLGALGTFEIVLADPLPEVFLEPTSSASEIAQALTDLREIAAELDAAAKPGPAAESRSELLRWLARTASRGPSGLVLPLGAAGRGLEVAGDSSPPAGPDPHGDPAAAAAGDEAWAATVAAMGWTALCWVPAPAGSASSRPGPAVAEELAQATGGGIASDPQELTARLRELAEAVRLTVELSGPADGRPGLLEVRSIAGDLSVRAPRWATVSTPRAVSQLRALATLEGTSEVDRGLETTAVLRAAPSPATGRKPVGVLEALTRPGPETSIAAIWRVTAVLARVDEPPEWIHELAAPGPLDAVDGWLYRRWVELGPELDGAAVVIEEVRSGRWGAAAAEFSDSGLATSGLGVAVWESPERLALSPAAADAARPATVVRLLPPRARNVRGKTRFDTLISSPIVRRVDFFLDDRLIASDDDAPFSAVVDLGPEPTAHTVRADAFTRDGIALGSDQLRVNSGDDRFQVSIDEIVATPAGGVTVEARVRLPAEATLQRVEFYRDQTLVDTLAAAPFRITLAAAEPTGREVVRVVAYLSDGTWIDDAKLLTPTGVAERIEVNLVELHVFVTDREGRPVPELRREDFRVYRRDAEQPIQHLALAEQVPLLLGLVIDTSESMWTLMPDTKKAGARFLTDTLTEGDRAFLVDFDTRPRLAEPITPEVVKLLRRFSALEADGFTALYDAVVFSMLQFEEAAGRKALVLLTDGDDYRSRYGPRRCIQYGRRLGVPVYIISLAGIQNPRRNLRRIDLEGLTEGTGGRVFYISRPEELGDAYASINRELRSQYILTLATDRRLDEQELEELRVRVAREGLAVRVVIGGQTSG